MINKSTKHTATTASTLASIASPANVESERDRLEKLSAKLYGGSIVYKFMSDEDLKRLISVNEHELTILKELTSSNDDGFTPSNDQVTDFSDDVNIDESGCVSELDYDHEDAIDGVWEVNGESDIPA